MAEVDTTQQQQQQQQQQGAQHDDDDDGDHYGEGADTPRGADTISAAAAAAAAAGEEDEGLLGPALLQPNPIIATTADGFSPLPTATTAFSESELPPAIEVYEPRQRAEWQTMLSSVLGSEVLKAETKRITSADAPVLTPTQLMYQRWLEIHARLRGRAGAKAANPNVVVEAEEKKLRAVWEPMLRDLARAVKEWTPTPDIIEVLRQTSIESEPSTSSSSSSAAAAAATPTSPAPHPTRTFHAQEAKDEVLKQVGDLLNRVDVAESQFPSTRKAIETYPEWGSAEVQNKLAALYSWYNVSNMLRLQISILQRWTDSEDLEIERPHHAPADLLPAVIGSGIPTEGTTFVERIFKEDNLTSTFEKRTLSALNRVIEKAKRNILRHHATFEKLQLPSFEPELVRVISFPTRLMEAALRLRLDYAGKLHDPGMLIVDSLTDDLRAAIAVACRIKVLYTQTMVADPGNGWDPPSCIAKAYDIVLREALTFFFKLLNFKLMGSVFFKETEILEPEWKFLSTAADVIEGGDFIVAKNITHIVNKLFNRIVEYFEKELNAPSTSRGSRSAPNPKGPVPAAIGQPTASASVRAPPQVGGLTRGKVRLSLEETTKWIHAVFDNVRIRSRKLLGFARDIRLRLENAAEYDLTSLRYGQDRFGDGDHESSNGGAGGAGAGPSVAGGGGGGASRPRMDLNVFMQTLINADFFLVYTESYEDQGIYIVAEPSLHDRPELVHELLTRCISRSREDDDLLFNREGQVGGDGEDDPDEAQVINGSALDGGKLGLRSIVEDDDQHSHYLLLLSPRDPFLWTGRVMTYPMAFKGIELKDHRMRLVADGPKGRLQSCKEHLMSIFSAAAAAAQNRNGGGGGDGSNLLSTAAAALAANKAVPKRASTGAAAAAAAAAAAILEEEAAHAFPLEVIHEHMAHMSEVQRELKQVNKGIFMLSNSIITSTPIIRQKMRNKMSNLSRLEHRRPHHHQHGHHADMSAMTTMAMMDQDRERDRWLAGQGENCDELIQNCFSMAAEQGFRSLPFMDSAKLRVALTLTLARLSIDWVAFICEDCVPTDRKTFKWAVAALENAMQVTRADNIFKLSEHDFALMRNKVASCMALLISHFDIMGARSSAAKAKEEQERLEREKAERTNLRAGEAEGRMSMDSQASSAISGTTVGGGEGVDGLLNGDGNVAMQRPESPIQATGARWASKGREWDAARQEIERTQQLIGRVLDETRLEDRGLSFLASSSKLTIRWQQGRMIGSGTFGTVYSAVNLDTGELMAVKEIRFQDITSNPEVYKQIKDEMSVMEMLSHPNIVNYFGIEVHRDKVYIFEEYCENGSLAQLLKAGRIEDEAVIQVYTLWMLDGLQYLHSQGVVHRDIKPDNILLDSNGMIKYVDFGAAKIIAKTQGTIQRTRVSRLPPGLAGGHPADAIAAGGGGGNPDALSIQGTPMYMSPEVINPGGTDGSGGAGGQGSGGGRRRTGRLGAMDVWSLGCVVLECATGRRPWAQLDNEWAIMFQIGNLKQAPALPDPDQLSGMGIDFIRLCLTIDPEARPTANELREHPWILESIEMFNAANAEEGECFSPT
ncbi:unnamed protein product [Tilletia laevis]|uniref:Protein kinase domain-containing protein n=2 Tax=Tilletia TaxID=13289 RepID=A0A8T8T227_9BASI|nr:hypothetical protein CF336_g6962 [Tilletia laevis]KAE8252153.1 hypothetical protein A4X03_0g6243 [Tilletia caries]KAE8190509.1 hypothetical protein CF335_g6338 [Tilletia laevis]CAD6896502.1 unnamed protein product [Tilletia caries]CAD6907704.1 unnamed protein product [Tilletia caries]